MSAPVCTQDFGYLGVYIARIAKIPYSLRIPPAYSPYSDNKVFRTYKTGEGTSLCGALLP